MSSEKKFHDEWAQSIDLKNVMVDETFEACTAPENRYITKFLGDLSGKQILELGCGAGEASIYFSKKGAAVTATDISGEMLNVVKRLAQKNNVTVNTKQCSSNNLLFENASYDILYAANLLHHVDIQSTLREVRRVLKPGGIFVCWDPLAYNPIINIYRKIATKVRTEDEHPIQIEDLTLFKDNFSQVDIHTTWFFTLWIFIKYYFIDKINPNNERYWKKILIDHQNLKKTYLFLEHMDNKFLRAFPSMNKFCWNITIIAKN